MTYEGVILHLPQMAQRKINVLRASTSAGIFDPRVCSSSLPTSRAHFLRVLASTAGRSGSRYPTRRICSAFISARSSARITRACAASVLGLIGTAPLPVVQQQEFFTTSRIRRNRFGLDVAKKAAARTKSASAVSGGVADIVLHPPLRRKQCDHNLGVAKVIVRTLDSQLGIVRTLTGIVCAGPEQVFSKLNSDHSRAFSPLGARTGAASSPFGSSRRLLLEMSGDRGGLQPAPLSQQRVVRALYQYPGVARQRRTRSFVFIPRGQQIPFHGQEVVPSFRSKSFHFRALRPASSPSSATVGTWRG